MLQWIPTLSWVVLQVWQKSPEIAPIVSAPVVHAKFTFTKFLDYVTVSLCYRARNINTCKMWVIEIICE